MLRRLKQALVLACVLAVIGLVGINASVRVLGGAPNLLSPFFLSEKVTALRAYIQHMVWHPFRPCITTTDILLRRAARRHGLPEDFVRAIARAESGGHPHRISHAGAMGVMQLMPGTARELNVRDPFDAHDNIDGGVRYLRRLWRRYRGDRRRVAAAYNAGPGRVPRHGPLRLPAETRVYVSRIASAQR